MNVSLNIVRLIRTTFSFGSIALLSFFYHIKFFLLLILCLLWFLICLIRWAIVYLAQMKPLIVPILS